MGLDASTTTIGLSVIEHENYQDLKLLHVEFFKPQKDIDLFEKLSKVRQFIFDRINKYEPDEVALEDILLFMQGKSTATTISSLAVLNRTVGLAIYDALGKSPNLLNVMKIRHAIKQSKKLPAKDEIPTLVANILKIEFPYVLNKKKKICIENYDMADAIAVGLAFAKLNRPVEPAEMKRTKKIATVIEQMENIHIDQKVK